MAERLKKYDVSYANGETRTKQLTEGDAERLSKAGATVKQRGASQDKKRSTASNKSRKAETAEKRDEE